MAKYIVTGEQRDDIDGQMLEIKRQLRLKSGSPINPKEVSFSLQDIIEGKFNPKEKEIIIFRLLDDAREIIIDSCDGNETIAGAKEFFTSGIDDEFKKYEVNEINLATEQTEVHVLVVTKRVSFYKILPSLCLDFDKLCLTHGQIINFCKRFKRYLSKGKGTLFVYKVKKKFFIARVCLEYDGSPFVFEMSFDDYDNTWNAEDGIRIVVPKQKFKLLF